MIDANHPPPHDILECLFVFEVFRRIGFPPEEIFAGLRNIVGEGRCVCVVLRSGGLEFTWTIAQTRLEQPEFERLWAEAGEAWNNLPKSANPWGFKGSRIDRMTAMAVSSIVRKGILIPTRREHAS